MDRIIVDAAKMLGEAFWSFVFFSRLHKVPLKIHPIRPFVCVRILKRQGTEVDSSGLVGCAERGENENVQYFIWIPQISVNGI